MLGGLGGSALGRSGDGGTGKSLWYPDRRGLVAIQGPLSGRHLPLVSSDDTTWGEWVSHHPASRILE